MAESAGPDPRRIATAADLARELELLRSRAAHGARRSRLSLDELARRTGIPRSTVHSYVRGVRLPPPDSLDDLVIAMGAGPAEQREWAEALFRIAADRFEPPTPSAPARTAPAPRQLPAAPRMLLGRTAELDRLNELLATADPTAALVVAVNGTGGVGKTALALRWAHDVSGRFPDGQLWLDLRGFSPGEPLPAADGLERLLRGLGIATHELAADVETRAAAFRSAVAGKRVLLLLDNARDSAQVLPMLPGTPGCVTLVTSRATLRTLVAIGGAESLPVARLPTETALGLLTAANPLPDAAVAERIAGHCGGLPLALQIMRDRLSRSRPEELTSFAEELDRDGRTRLAALELTDPGIDLSVRDALRWSYEALPPTAATLFRRLPLCYQASIERSAVAALLDLSEPAAERQLQLLVDANLLDTAGPGHYRMHDLVLTYAAECLARDEEESQIRQCQVRMAGYLIDLAESAVRSWDPRRPFRTSRPAPLAATGRELPPELAARQVEAFEKALRELAHDGMVEIAAALGERASRAIISLGDLGTIVPALNAVISTAAAAGDDLAAAVLLRYVGISHGRRGELTEADQAFTQAISLAHQAGSPVNEALDRSNRAVIWAMRGELIEARTVLAEQAHVLQDLGADAASVRLSLVDIDLSRGDLAAAADWAEQAVTALGPVLDEGGAMAIEAWIASAQIACATGQLNLAAERLHQLEASHALHRHREYRAQAALVRATLQRELGAYPAAEQAAQAALLIATEMADRRSETAAMLLLGELALLTDRPADAIERYQQARQRAEQANLRHPLAQALAALASALNNNGQQAEAQRYAQHAEQIALDCGFQLVLAQARAVLTHSSS